jgi:hypothetical protein
VPPGPRPFDGERLSDGMPAEDSSQALRSTSLRAAAAIAAAGVAVLLATALLPPQRILSRPNHGDTREYFHYAQRTYDGQVPYRDFTLEYPPGALPVFLAAGPADRGYHNRFRLLMLGLGVASIVLLVMALFVAGADAADLAAGVLVPATLPLTLNPGLVFERFDLWPVFLMLLAVVALLRGRQLLCLVALSIGAVAKLFPLAFVPLALLARRGHAHLRRDVAIAAAVGLAFLLPFGAIAPRGLGHVGALLVRRPLQSESLGASILFASHRLGFYTPTTYYSMGNSWDLAGPAAKVVAVVSSLAEAAALVAVWFFFARSRRGSRELLLAVAAVVVGFVAFGKVFSTQYMVWVAFAVPLALGRIRPFALAATISALLLSLYNYGWGFFDLLAGGRTSWVMLTRNLILVVLFGSLLLELAARGRVRAAGPADLGAPP